jgi:SecD/SecF fusion protein
LYDTIIVFDRIRENVPRMPRATFSQIVNRSMSEVITRSLVTSLSTLLPIIALMLFGGETLRDFGFALLIGVASGTYSSIFIAAPVLTHWKERETVWRRREKIVLEDHGGMVPAYAETSLGDEDAAPAAVRRRVGRKKAAPVAAEAEPAAVDGSAVAVEEAPEPEQEPERAAAPSPRPAGSRPSTPEARRAARRAARAAELGKPDGGGAPQPTSEDDAAAAKRAAANRRRKRHGRPR